MKARIKVDGRWKTNPEYSRDYYRKHRQEKSSYQRKWREEHRQQFLDTVKAYRAKHNQNVRLWKQNNPEKRKAQSLMSNNPTKFPLDSQCEFCSGTEKLEHGHIDYELPEIYLTVCHQCNVWMDKS